MLQFLFLMFDKPGKIISSPVPLTSPYVEMNEYFNELISLLNH